MFSEIKMSKQFKTILDNKSKVFDKAMEDLDKAFDTDFFKASVDKLDTILSFAGAIPAFPPSNVYAEKNEVDPITFQPLKTPTYTHVVELALSGYKSEDVDVSVETNNGVNFLVIESKGLNEKRENRTWYQRGIAGRAFKMSFKLASGVKVESALLTDGLLTVRLFAEPEVAKPSVQKIKVSTK